MCMQARVCVCVWTDYSLLSTAGAGHSRRRLKILLMYVTRDRAGHDVYSSSTCFRYLRLIVAMGESSRQTGCHDARVCA